MMIRDEIMTLLEVKHLEGVGKSSGKPYSFYTLILGDDEYNKLPCNIGREDLVEGLMPNWIFDAAEKKLEIVCDLELLPKEFDVKLIASNIRPSRENI